MAKKTGGGGKPQKYGSDGRYRGGGCALVFLAAAAALIVNIV
jgi:hypothetical protein